MFKCVRHNTSASRFYGVELSKMACLDHSRRIPAGFVKATQKVDGVHVVDVKNLQLENQHCLVCMWGCLCYQFHFSPNYSETTQWVKT